MDETMGWNEGDILWRGILNQMNNTIEYIMNHKLRLSVITFLNKGKVRDFTANATFLEVTSYGLLWPGRNDFRINLQPLRERIPRL